LGIALAGQGKAEEALAIFRQATQARPDVAQAHHNLGVALAQGSKPTEAADSLRQAIRLQPGYAEAQYNLGAVLGTLGQRDEAIAAYREAVRLRPDYGEAYNNLGLALPEAGKPEEAVVLLRQAVRLRPQAAEGPNNLGLALAELGRFAEAEAAYHEALRLNPRYAEAHANLGNAYKEQGRTQEALACYGLALALAPDAASARYNRSLALLQAGDYERGWAEYEWRWKRPTMPPRHAHKPRWDGKPLEGRTILLWCEQGLGDAIQFVRYAPLVKARGGSVVLECPPPLRPLFQACAGVDRLVAEGESLPDCDVQAPLLSLPGLLGTTLETVPAAVPYLAAEEARVEQWGRLLRQLPGFKVGIVWQGNPRFPWDRYRSFPLDCLAPPLAAVDGVRLVSLQKGPGVEQLNRLARRFDVAVLPEELDAAGPFQDTAAVMKGLDLVVTCDTAAAHLAGALGVPAWVALAAVADWRWLQKRADTPWYPTLRLFGQKELGNWAGVFQEMAAALESLAATRAGGVPVTVAPGELIDKLTILAIKAERIADPAKLAHVRAERAALQQVREKRVLPSAELTQLEAALRRVHEALWEVEAALRCCERAGDFGERFVGLARSVYRHNDERAALKRRIDELLGAPFSEQKDYPAGG
jgi:Flp pilus assembly protein TadD